MTTEQESQLTLPRMGGKPEVSKEDLDSMLYWLGQIGGWATCETLLRWMEWPVTESNRRRLRRSAEASRGHIASGPSTPGYILTRLITPKDLHLIDGLKSQADRMRNRYTAIMRVWHKPKRTDVD